MLKTSETFQYSTEKWGSGKWSPFFASIPAVTVHARRKKLVSCTGTFPSGTKLQSATPNYSL